MLTKRIGYVVARNDTSAAPGDDAIGTAISEVFTFWRDTMGNYLTIVPKRLSNVDIALSNKVFPTPEQIADAAVAALRALYPADADPTKECDCVFVIVHPGTFLQPTKQPPAIEGFRAKTVTVSGGLPVSVVSTATHSYSTYFHELGHALGFGHPLGVISVADGVPSTEYGSPYDIMGAPATNSVPGATPAWSYMSSFQGTAVTGFPALHLREGPNLSRAQLALTWPDALHATVVDRPRVGGHVGAHIAAPKLIGSMTPAHPGTVMILRGPAEPSVNTGRIFIEYRTADGWDAGLATAQGDSVRAGVVVHQIDTASGTSRLWFRGAVFVDSADADLQLDGSGLTLTVTKFGDEYAEVEVTMSATPSVRIDIVGEVSQLRNELDVVTKRTPCGGTYRQGTWETDTRVEFAARTTGFGGLGGFGLPDAEIVWTIDGVRVADHPDWLQLPGTSFWVWCWVDPQTFRMTARTATGDKFDASVQAYLSVAPTLVASSTLSPEGRYSGIEPSGYATIFRCIKQLIPIPADWFLFKRPPNPLLDDLIDLRVEAQRDAWAVRRIAAVRGLGMSRDQTRLAKQFIRAQVPGRSTER